MRPSLTVNWRSILTREDFFYKFDCIYNLIGFKLMFLMMAAPFFACPTSFSHLALSIGARLGKSLIIAICTLGVLVCVCVCVCSFITKLGHVM